MKANAVIILIAIALLGGGVWYFVFRKKNDKTPETSQLPATSKPSTSKPTTQTQLPKLSIREQNQQNLAKWIRLAVTYKKKNYNDAQGDRYLIKALEEYRKLNYVQPLSEIRMSYYALYKSDMVADIKKSTLWTTSEAYKFFQKA